LIISLLHNIILNIQSINHFKYVVKLNLSILRKMLMYNKLIFCYTSIVLVLRRHFISSVTAFQGYIRGEHNLSRYRLFNEETRLSATYAIPPVTIDGPMSQTLCIVVANDNSNGICVLVTYL
jgi:hypothetical protein